MHIALQGALVGFGLGLLIWIADVSVLRAAVKERFKRTKRNGELNPTEKKRISSLAFFCLVVMPVVFAFFAWMVF
jgi:hypothetical protein